jgi:hypothetical protein
VADHLIGGTGHLRRRARLSLRPARPPAALAPQRLRRRLAHPFRRRRLRGAARRHPWPGPQLGDLPPQCPGLPAQLSKLCLVPPVQPLVPRLPHRDLGVLRPDHLPQPGISRPQGSVLTAGRSRRIGRKPSRSRHALGDRADTPGRLWEDRHRARWTCPVTFLIGREERFRQGIVVALTG